MVLLMKKFLGFIFLICLWSNYALAEINLSCVIMKIVLKNFIINIPRRVNRTRNIYNHKFNVSILLTIPLLSNVHGIKLLFAVLLQIQLWRLNLSFIIHETAYHAMYMVQQSAFYSSPNTNFATKIADNKIRPPFCKKKWPPFW